MDMHFSRTAPTRSDWGTDADALREGGATGARVIVVDDDDDLRDLVKHALAREGYEVKEATSGAELLLTLESIALDAWPLNGVDLIVLDLLMPGMSGLDVVRILRAANWDTPAILMTALAEPSVLVEAKRLGVAVLSKPFDVDALRQTALALLAGVNGGDRTNGRPRRTPSP